MDISNRDPGIGPKRPLRAETRDGTPMLPLDEFWGTSLLRAAIPAWNLCMNDEDRLELWAPVLLEALHGLYGANPTTAKKIVADAQRFIRFLIARGVEYWWQVTPELVDEFLWAARPDRNGRHRSVSAATARNRRWTVKGSLETTVSLGVNLDVAALLGDPIGSTPPKESARPLTEVEAQTVRDFADAGLWTSERPVLAGLAFAGGTPREIAAVTGADVDIDNATVRFSGSSERTNPVDEWSLVEIASHLRSNPHKTQPGTPLCVTASLPHGRATHSVTVRLRNILIDADLAGRPGIKAGSIRLTAAAAIAASDGIFAAARFLGNKSLDRTVAALGWNSHGAPDA
ncbi:hypothetical protein [Candidatus Poriferisodalis sp.]|uniref:hypothetical protein n=1 Tax=Candidatus Poriferisodalis sp. TaxID=3101277 RepID=UPI003B51A2DF